MRLFTILGRDDYDRLVALARRERRHPRDQAAVLLERALRPDHRRGGDSVRPGDRVTAPEMAASHAR